MTIYLRHSLRWVVAETSNVYRAPMTGEHFRTARLLGSKQRLRSKLGLSALEAALPTPGSAGQSERTQTGI